MNYTITCCLVIAVVFPFPNAVREGSRLETAWRNQLFKEDYQGAEVLQTQRAPEADCSLA